MELLRKRVTARSMAAAALLAAVASFEARAEKPTKGIAATKIEFQGLKDREPITFRDMAAYAELLKRAREAGPAFAEQAMSDVGFRALWEHPEDYRGVFIELRGFCRALIPRHRNS